MVICLLVQLPWQIKLTFHLKYLPAFYVKSLSTFHVKCLPTFHVKCLPTFHVKCLPSSQVTWQALFIWSSVYSQQHCLDNYHEQMLLFLSDVVPICSTQTSNFSSNWIYVVQDKRPEWSGGVKVSCILHHRGVQLILAYSCARPAILKAGKGRGGMFLFFCFFTVIPVPFSSLSLFFLLYYLFYLFSSFLWEKT